MAQLLYTLNNVSYSYPGGIAALRGLIMEIRQGDRVAVIGANGSGKSTLLTLLDALIFADSGEALFRGEALTERSLNDARTQRRFRRAVGYVFQNPERAAFFAPRFAKTFSSVRSSWDLTEKKQESASRQSRAGFALSIWLTARRIC